jgi:hypothetical protein
MVDVDTYEVVVEKPTETVHRVTLTSDYYRRLCNFQVTHEWLIIQAFRFLLEREDNTSILRSFDLSEISRYFPEFESEIRARVGA